jgi:c-di-GMP-binding flagellar brake protein YcgR
MEHKRQHKRAAVRLSATYIKKDLPNFTKEITIKDISAGGLCFQSNEAVETKSVVIISVYLQERDQQLKLEGVVRWSRLDDISGGYLNGVQFTDVDSSDFQAFLGFYCMQILKSQ